MFFEPIENSYLEDISNGIVNVNFGNIDHIADLKDILTIGYALRRPLGAGWRSQQGAGSMPSSNPIEEPEKDVPLRDDIRVLGRILGDTVREQEGEV